MKFPYEWWLKDGYPAKGVKAHNKTVFGTFICGGGSSMGYKLAGFDHLGGVEMDPQVAAAYKINHNPKYLYVEDIRDFNDRNDLPEELYNLDLLDGSPPCSSFSMAGSRDKAWGKEKHFREGQKKQRLDDLVFIYIDTIKKLKPKTAVLENVKGLVQGNAKAYARKIKSDFESTGYKVQVFLLNSATMGVPQARERVFFVGVRSDVYKQDINLKFSEDPVYFKEIDEGIVTNAEYKIAPCDLKYYDQCKPGAAISSVHPKSNRFNSFKLSPGKVCKTITAGSSCYHPKQKRALQNIELKKIGSYPQDYDFQAIKPQYLIGMSVPPVMTAHIASQIYSQWLKPLD